LHHFRHDLMLRWSIRSERRIRLLVGMSASGN
jgi:hypothetical protein